YEHTNIYPFGLGPENIDHEGHPQSAMRTHASWGEGSGIFTGLSDASYALEGAFADLSKNIYAGVDGVTIKDIRLTDGTISLQVNASLSRLQVPWRTSYPVKLKISGLPPAKKSFSLEL